MSFELNHNILYFDQPFSDLPIYRVMHIERLIELLVLKKLILRQPHQWDDPFENYILRKYKRVGKTKAAFPADIFGQCWSLHAESDAMWRIYAHEKMGVKIKSSVLKLLSQLYNAPELQASPKTSCFIGKVEYHDTDLVKVIADINDPDFTRNDPEANGMFAAAKLLVKRKEFSHESEVRLLYVEHFANKEGKLGLGMRALLPLADNVDFRFTIDPASLIDEIMMDPRMTEHTCRAYIDYIRKIGFNGPICQSELYSIPGL